MHFKTHIFILLALCLTTSMSMAQDTTATENFDDYGDVDSKPVKSFCTQKVLYITPTRLISVGYEAQMPFDFASQFSGNVINPNDPLLVSNSQTATRGLRLAFNTPIISRSNFILNLGLTYWNSSYNFDRNEVENSPFLTQLNSAGIRTTGVNATVFKPLDNKHFIIAQVNADLNGDYRSFDDISGRNMTYSATAIYGWKKSDNLMWGIGASRTYRAGALLHIPVLFYNRTFNPKWGVEILLPARANLRRNFGTSSMLLLGYELEGNAYYLNDSNLYLRRGELKPRITYERQIRNFIWLSAQVGWRYNWRFDVYNAQNPQGGDEQPRVSNTLGNPLYFNVSINLVSP